MVEEAEELVLAPPPCTGWHSNTQIRPPPRQREPAGIIVALQHLLPGPAIDLSASWFPHPAWPSSPAMSSQMSMTGRLGSTPQKLAMYGHAAEAGVNGEGVEN